MILILLFFVFFVLKTGFVMAVLCHENIVYLYEDGQRIKDDSVIQCLHYQTPVCKKGTYVLPQIVENITFFKIRDKNVMDYAEWIDNWYLTHRGCEGFARKEEQIQDALEEWQQTERFKNVHRRVQNISLSSEDRLRMWKDLEPHKTDFMLAKGFDFYDNPVCAQINLSEYDDIYLKHLRDTAIYSTAIKLPDFDFNVKQDRILSVDLKTGEVLDVTEKNMQNRLVARFFVWWNLLKEWIVSF